MGWWMDFQPWEQRATTCLINVSCYEIWLYIQSHSSLLSTFDSKAINGQVSTCDDAPNGIVREQTSIGCETYSWNEYETVFKSNHVFDWCRCRLPQLVECGPLPPMVNLLLTSLRGEIVLVESHDLLDRALNGLNQAAAVIAQLTPSVEQAPQVSGFTPTHFLVLI